MISAKSEFKLQNRNFKDTVVLIPGWATDYRIFKTLDLNYNYLVPTIFNPFDFSGQLLKFLNKMSIDKISVFGWSLGGFLATEFALKNTQRVDEVILLSIQRRFDKNRLEEIKLKLKKNKSAYLYKFYTECFSRYDREGFLWFKRQLLKNYINAPNLNELIYSLDYLSMARIRPASLARLKRLRIFHGKEDRITPHQEIVKLKSYLPRVKFIFIPKTGHIPFLNQNFKKNFYNGQKGDN